MRELDELHMKFPFYGIRKLRFELHSTGTKLNRKHAQRLMRLMGIAALVPQPTTTIAYIPTKQGFGYFVAVMDWVLASRSFVQTIKHT